MVAVNPFKKVPLYGDEYIEAYKRKTIESPHVYAITDTAIREMIRGGLLFHNFYEFDVSTVILSCPANGHLFVKFLPFLSFFFFFFQTK